MKTLRDYMKENILDSVKEKLSPDVWSEKKLKTSLKAYILAKFRTWLKAHAGTEEIKKAFFLGSMTGFQYNEEADLDINIVVDLPDKRIKELSKLLPNGHNFPGTKHPINYYISNKIRKEWEKSGPIYDILKDKWIVEPSKKTDKMPIVRNFRAVVEIARFFLAGLDSALSEYESDKAAYLTYKEYLKTSDEEDKDEIKRLLKFKLNELVADTDGIFIARHIIHALRTEAFEHESEVLKIITKIEIKDANTSINNLIYKYLERLGYQEKITKVLEEKEKWTKELNSY